MLNSPKLVVITSNLRAVFDNYLPPYHQPITDNNCAVATVVVNFKFELFKKQK